MSNFTVCARFRPLSSKEKRESGDTTFIHNLDPETFVLKDEKEGEFTFCFDKVFYEDSKQSDVYEFLALPIVKDAANAINGTIIVYGQAGAGKTYSIEGNGIMECHGEETGLLPRVVDGLFQCLNDEMTKYTVKLSMVEIYKEKMRDLFDLSKDNLQIKESKRRGIYLTGVTEAFISDPAEASKELAIGAVNRAVGETQMNMATSRSHCVYIITVQLDSANNRRSKSGKLILVDLAGSEKVEISGSKGKVHDEAKTIDKSVSALGDVINALTNGSPGKINHIPYRNSKLTRFLQDSLAGNSRTALLCCCSPSTLNSSESLSTIRFGARAKQIKTPPRVISTEDNECVSTNLGLSLSIPGVREVADYGKREHVPFLRPDEYITTIDDEVNRLLESKNIYYDADSDDENWLKELNTSIGKDNNVSIEMLGYMMDKLERAAYYRYNPFQESEAINMFSETKKDIVVAVYYYWKKKRRLTKDEKKKKMPNKPKALFRILLLTKDEKKKKMPNKPKALFRISQTEPAKKIKKKTKKNAGDKLLIPDLSTLRRKRSARKRAEWDKTSGIRIKGAAKKVTNPGACSVREVADEGNTQDEINKLKKSVDPLNGDREREAVSEMETIQKKLDVQVKESEYLNEEISELQKNEMLLQKKLEAQQKESKNLKVRISSLEKNEVLIQKKLSEVKMENEKLVEGKKDSEKNLESAISQKTAVEKRLAQSLKEFDDLKQEKEGIELQKENIDKNLKVKISKLEKNEASILKKLSEVKMENEKLVKGKKDSEKNLESVISQKTAVEKRLAQSLKVFDDLKQEKERVELQKESIEKDRVYQLAKINDLEKHVQELVAMIASFSMLRKNAAEAEKGRNEAFEALFG